MSHRHLTDGYAVSGQITPAQVAELKAAGFTTVINNRPDGEIGPEAQGEAVQAAAVAEGLTYVANPFSPTAFDDTLVERQAEAIAAAEGPVLAYCASGNRSTILWAMSQVRAGAITPDEAVAAAADNGYDLRGVLPKLQALAPS